jgi:hypothetical protein
MWCKHTKSLGCKFVLWVHIEEHNAHFWFFAPKMDCNKDRWSPISNYNNMFLLAKMSNNKHVTIWGEKNCLHQMVWRNVIGSYNFGYWTNVFLQVGWVQAKVDHFLCHSTCFCKVSCIKMSLTCHKINIMSNFPLN